jgi:Alpha/beta hydrolase domain
VCSAYLRIFKVGRAELKSVSIAAPARHAPYFDWDLSRKDRFENGMCNLQGTSIPFASTRAERLAAGIPRPSIEKRHPNREAHVAAFETAARDLVGEGFLLSARCHTA